MKILFSIPGFLTLVSMMACGPLGSNKDVPEKADELTAETYESEPENELWQAVADRLGVHNNKTDANLELFLSQPPALLTERVEEYQATLGKLQQQWVAQAAASQCAGVDRVVSMGSDETTTALLVSYRTKSSEQQHHTIVTYPIAAADGSLPVVLYAHAGNKGLGLNEVLGINYGLKDKAIIVAPAFGEEPICKGQMTASGCDARGVLAENRGATRVWLDAADQLLAAQDCLVKALGGIPQPTIQGAGPAMNLTLQQALGPKVAANGGAGPMQALPKTAIVGNGHGGVTAKIATAKAATLAQAAHKSPEFVAAHGQPTAFFSCAAQVTSPSTLSMGQMRLVTEMVIKGRVQHTRFAGIPGVLELQAELSGIEGSVSEKADAIVTALVARDPVLLTPLWLAGVSNWSQLGGVLQGQSRHLLVHRESHPAYPSTQAKILAGVVKKVGADPAIRDRAGLSAVVHDVEFVGADEEIPAKVAPWILGCLQ